MGIFYAYNLLLIHLEYKFNIYNILLQSYYKFDKMLKKTRGSDRLKIRRYIIQRKEVKK